MPHPYAIRVLLEAGLEIVQLLRCRFVRFIGGRLRHLDDLGRGYVGFGSEEGGQGVQDRRRSSDLKRRG